MGRSCASCAACGWRIALRWSSASVAQPIPAPCTSPLPPPAAQVKEVPAAAAAWAEEYGAQQAAAQGPAVWGEEFAAFQAQQHPAAKGEEWAQDFGGEGGVAGVLAGWCAGAPARLLSCLL